MNELIKYLINLLNIKTESKFVIADMEEDLKGIKDFIAYRTYIRENLNSFDTKFQTGFQKFITLTKRYKEIEFKNLNKNRLSESKKIAKEIAEKVRLVAPIILKMQSEFKKVEFKNFAQLDEKLFTIFEISQLAKIGNALQCVNLQKSESGKDPLEDKLKKMFREVVRVRVRLLPKISQSADQKRIRDLTKKGLK